MLRLKRALHRRKRQLAVLIPHPRWGRSAVLAYGRCVPAVRQTGDPAARCPVVAADHRRKPMGPVGQAWLTPAHRRPRRGPVVFLPQVAAPRKQAPVILAPAGYQAARQTEADARQDEPEDGAGRGDDHQGQHDAPDDAAEYLMPSHQAIVRSSTTLQAATFGIIATPAAAAELDGRICG
jgi:hypothetical protein